MSRKGKPCRVCTCCCFSARYCSAFSFRAGGTTAAAAAASSAGASRCRNTNRAAVGRRQGSCRWRTHGSWVNSWCTHEATTVQVPCGAAGRTASDRAIEGGAAASGGGGRLLLLTFWLAHQNKTCSPSPAGHQTCPVRAGRCPMAAQWCHSFPPSQRRRTAEARGAKLTQSKDGLACTHNSG